MESPAASEHSAAALCDALGIGRSSFYEYRSRRDGSEAAQELEREVIRIFWRHKRRYGARRIRSDLADIGIAAGRCRVREVMRRNGLAAIQPKSFVPRTTQTDPMLARSPNLLLDRPLPDGPSQVWVGDITYLPLAGGGWLYLSTWLDLWSHVITGWHVDDHMREELVMESFRVALKRRRTSKGLIVHSDGGGQYASKGFRTLLGQREFRQSMTRTNNHYDNATAESLFSRFKAELLEDGTFASLEEARMEIFDYIDCYYNPTRKHSSLGNKSPFNFEREAGY
jgi:transposase InsO family protein